MPSDTFLKDMKMSDLLSAFLWMSIVYKSYERLFWYSLEKYFDRWEDGRPMIARSGIWRYSHHKAPSPHAGQAGHRQSHCQPGIVLTSGKLPGLTGQLNNYCLFVVNNVNITSRLVTDYMRSGLYEDILLSLLLLITFSYTFHNLSQHFNYNNQIYRKRDMLLFVLDTRYRVSLHCSVSVWPV